MEYAPIQWPDSTVNPTMGCNGCVLWNKDKKICYAGNETETFGAHRKGYPAKFEQVTPYPGRMAKAARWRDLTGLSRPTKPWLNGMPRLIFVSDMGDSLSKEITFAYLKVEVIRTVTSERGRRHEWLWLTKRSGRMAEFSRWLAKRGMRWPANLWAGTSVLNQDMTNQVAPLLKVGDDRTVHFLSVEPQWEPIDLREWLPDLDWVIQGGQSGSTPAVFQLDWADDLREQCRASMVPYFLKQLGGNATLDGEPYVLRDRHGGDWSEWPEELRVREMPQRDWAARREGVGDGVQVGGDGRIALPVAGD